MPSNLVCVTHAFVGLVMLMSPVAPLTAADDPAAYIVGPNDVLTITVYDQPQMSGRYAVEADGTFTFPLIGRVAVGGRTLRGTEDELRGRLAAGYLKNPQVRVAIEQYRSQQIYVMGEVRQPGMLQFTGSMTVLEALARVGATTERAGREAMLIRSRQGGAQLNTADVSELITSERAEVIRVDLEALRTGALSQNVSLQGGDTIFIPEAPVETVFVTGHVRSPGEYPLRPAMTVRQALALAGGVTDRGSSRRIQIIREREGVETTIGASLQDAVQVGDTIVVRERFF